MNAKRRYLLSGKLVCKECGHAMIGNARNCGRTKALYVTYKCTNSRFCCKGREFNQGYLEQYVVFLLEKYIFNASAIKHIMERIDAEKGQAVSVREDEIAKINEQLDEVEQAIQNITAAIATGMRFDSLLDKLSELEENKAVLETELQRKMNNGASEPELKDIRVEPWQIPMEYQKVKNDPYSLAYKNFIQAFIEQITVGRYQVDITLRTGLEMFPHLNTTITTRRQEIYERGKGTC